MLQLDLFEFFYLVFGFLLCMVGALLIGYTRNEENRARLLRFFLKKNYGIVVISYKGGFDKRIVHDFSNPIVQIGKGENTQTYLLKKEFLHYEAGLPVAYFNEVDCLQSELTDVGAEVKVHGIPAEIKSLSEKKVPPQELSSCIVLVKNLSAVEARQTQKILLYFCIAAVGFAVAAAVLSYLNQSSINEVKDLLYTGFNMSKPVTSGFVLK